MIMKAVVPSQSVACWHSGTNYVLWLYSCPQFGDIIPHLLDPFFALEISNWALLQYKRNSVNIDFDILAKMRIVASNEACHEQMTFLLFYIKYSYVDYLEKS